MLTKLPREVISKPMPKVAVDTSATTSPPIQIKRIMQVILQNRVCAAPSIAKSIDTAQWIR